MSTTFRRSVLGLAAVGAALALAACSGPAAPDDSSTAAAEPVYGGTLTFLESQAPTCLYAGGGGFYPNATILNQIGDKLTYQDPDTREISPWLATGWEVNDDATEYTFTLRDDVTFSDGSALDAATVALNFDHLGKGDEALGLSKQEFISNYVASEVVDDQTVRFTFSAPSPGFLQATSVVGATIVATATAELPYEEQCQLENTIATGPFTVGDIVPESQYSLVAREDYDWAPEVAEHQGRAYLDGIEIIVTPEDNVRIGALTAGQADAIRSVQVYDIDNIEASGATVSYGPTNGVNPQFALRPGNPILADPAVRQALLKATDTQAIIDTVYQGKFEKATSVLSQGATGYVDLSDKLEYDPEAAAALLDEAGWIVGDDGIRVKDGVRLELTTWVGAVFPLNQQLDELVAQQWEQVGVKLLVDTPDAATATAGQKDPLQLPVAITHVGRVDPDVLKSNFWSQSNRNALAFTPETADADLDQLLVEISTLPTEDERFEKAAEVQNYLIDNALTIPLYELPQTYAARAGVNGLTWESVGRVVLTGVWLQP
jgi:peptide/nickel transport system substrate-binding protein